MGFHVPDEKNSVGNNNDTFKETKIHLIYNQFI